MSTHRCAAGAGKRVPRPIGLKMRIDEAARLIPIEQLCLSPQCGFASSALSGLSMEVVERKLARIVEVADQVWG
jgi:5-methyltetrahydropteroyltriglutamate--homocysteine methyltransferase